MPKMMVVSLGHRQFAMNRFDFGRLMEISDTCVRVEQPKYDGRFVRMNTEFDHEIVTGAVLADVDLSPLPGNSADSGNPGAQDDDKPL